jgi:hypothetical protein
MFRPSQYLLSARLPLSTACCNLRRFWFCCWTSAPIIASLSAYMVVQLYCNEDIRCKWGLHSKATWFQLGSWSISLRIYSQILVPLRHLHTNAKPVPLVKRFQPLHQSLCNVKSLYGQSWRGGGGPAVKIYPLAWRTQTSTNFRLAVSNFDWALLERRWTTLPERKIARSLPLAIFCAAQNFRSGRRDHERWPSVYGVVFTGAYFWWKVTSGDGIFSPLQQTFQQSSLRCDRALTTF